MPDLGCLFSQIQCPVVLQVKKVDLVSAPQNNIESQAAPRMIKLTLTDGKSVCYTIEFIRVQAIRHAFIY